MRDRAVRASEAGSADRAGKAGIRWQGRARKGTAD